MYTLHVFPFTVSWINSLCFLEIHVKVLSLNETYKYLSIILWGNTKVQKHWPSTEQPGFAHLDIATALQNK